MRWSLFKQANAATDADGHLINEKGDVLADAEGNPIVVTGLAASPLSATASAVSPEISALREQLAASQSQAAAQKAAYDQLIAETAAHAKAETEGRIAASAGSFADLMVRGPAGDGKGARFLPAQRDWLAASHAEFARLDASDGGKRAEGFATQMAAVPTHTVVGERVIPDGAPLPDGMRALSNQGGTEQTPSPERIRKLLAMTDLGKSALASMQSNGNGNGNGSR